MTVRFVNLHGHAMYDHMWLWWPIQWEDRPAECGAKWRRTAG